MGLRDPYTMLPSFGPIEEESSVQITGILVDEAGAPLTALDAITATLFDRCCTHTGRLIRHNQNVLNANGGTFDPATGRFTLLLTPTDTRIADQGLRVVEHMLRLDFTYTPVGSTQRTGRYAAVLRIRNLEQLNESF